MVNYQLGKIYKIVCNITDESYIGSSCYQTLAQRLAKHVASYKRWKSGKHNYCSCYDIIERGQYQILLIESFSCHSKDELTSREGVIIREYKHGCGCTNIRIEGRNMKEWREDNKERLRDKMRDYRKLNNEKVRDTDKRKYEKHKDKIKIRKKEWYLSNKNNISEKAKEKITCICGSCICKKHKTRHERSGKHLNHLKSLQ